MIRKMIYNLGCCLMCFLLAGCGEDQIREYDEKTGDLFEYQIVENQNGEKEIIVYGYYGDESEIVIPAYIDGMRVAGIGRRLSYEEKNVQVSMGQRKKEIFVYSDNIKNILEKRGDEEIAFLDKYPTALRWIRLSSFDFNGDGVGEIILSDEYVETSTIVSYNQVYDVGGKLLFRFVAGDILDTEVFVDEAGSEYHIQSSLHIAAGHDVTFYERIFWLQKQEWKTELMFIEWDCRHGKEREDTEEKGYFIYDCFTEDETADIMETGYENTVDILNTKKANGTKEQLEKYVQSFEGQHKEKVTDIGIILNWEEGIKWSE